MFSLRCLIYKVHALRRSFVMISCRFPFVKHFFQVFSNFFSAFIRRNFDLSSPNLVEPGRALSSARLSYHSFFHLSSTFFRFSKSFSALNLSELVICALSSAQLSYQRGRFLSIGKRTQIKTIVSYIFIVFM